MKLPRSVQHASLYADTTGQAWPLLRTGKGPAALDPAPPVPPIPPFPPPFDPPTPPVPPGTRAPSARLLSNCACAWPPACCADE